MLNIIIDTNIFRKNPRLDSAAFASIKSSAKAKKISIHLPYIIENEYLSQVKNEYGKEIEKIIFAIEKLKRKKLSPSLKDEINEHKSKIDSLASKVKKYLNDDFNIWLKETNAIRHDIDIKKVKNAFTAYFDGTPPYSEIKSRKDIPDSLIFETIIELNKEVDNLHFICEDSSLNKAVSKLDDIHIYNSLEAFIESDVYQFLLKEEQIVKNFSIIKKKLSNDVSKFNKYLENNIEDFLQGRTFTDDNIHDDNNEATIDGISKPNTINIKYDSAIYYGEGIIVIPFELNVEALLSYHIFKGDYYSFIETRRKHLSISDHNDHYFAVEEEKDLFITGIIGCKIDITKLTNDTNVIVNLDSIEIGAVDGIYII